MRIAYAVTWRDTEDRVHVDNLAYDDKKLAEAAALLENYKHPSMRHQVAKIVIGEDANA